MPYDIQERCRDLREAIDHGTVPEQIRTLPVVLETIEALADHAQYIAKELLKAETPEVEAHEPC